MSPWFFLILAGIFEIGWPIGLKIASDPKYHWQGIILAVIFMALSGAALWMAQKSIPMGTAYAVWTGIGAVGAFVVGVAYYGDSLTFWRCFGAALIIAGVITLKVASH